VGKSRISGRFFFSVGLGPFRIGTSTGGVLDGITGEGLVWLALFVFVGMPILGALFEAFFFIVFVLLISLVLVAVSSAIFGFAIRREVGKGRHYFGSPILIPLGGVVLGIPTAAIYLLCLYRIPLVGRDWDYPNRIENCPEVIDTDLCEFTGIYGFAHIGWWIMALGVCTAYMLIVFRVGFALRKKWLPIAEQASKMRQLAVWMESGQGKKEFNENLRKQARRARRIRITERRAIERSLRGRTPRNTKPLRERTAKRLRRRALTLQGEPVYVNEENFGPYKKARVDLPPAFVTGVNPDIFAMNKKNTRTRLLEGNNKDNVDKILRAIQSPISPIVDDLISGDDSPSKKLAIEAQQQWVKDGGWKGLDNLARWFVHKNGNRQGYSHDEMRADVLSPTRDIRDVLDDYEKSIQPELRKIYDDWLESFNIPEELLMDGLRSNMGLLNSRTDTMRTNVDSDGSSIAPINKSIVRITAYALSEPGMPAVYIEDQDAGITHLITKDGEHLMSLARQKDGTMAFFPGSAAHKQIHTQNEKPSLRERIFKKRTAAPEAMSHL
jgi:hypothetical protein